MLFSFLIISYLFQNVECIVWHSKNFRARTTYHSKGKSWRSNAGILNYYIMINGIPQIIKQVNSDTCSKYHDCSTDKGCCAQDVKLQTLTLNTDIEINKNYMLPIFGSYYIDTELSKTIKRNIKDIMKDYNIKDDYIFINKIDSSTLRFSLIIPIEHHMEYNTSLSLFSNSNWGSNIYNITSIPKVVLHETDLYAEYTMRDLNTRNLLKVGIFDDKEKLSYNYFDWCYNNPCQNNAICYKQREPYYICDCQPGYYGEHCEKTYNITEHPCSNNAIYKEGRCQCRYGYYGEKCDEVKECEYVKCDKGKCIEEIGTFTCECDFFITGDNCNEMNTWKFIFFLICIILLMCMIKNFYQNHHCKKDYFIVKEDQDNSEENKHLSNNKKMYATV